MPRRGGYCLYCGSPYRAGDEFCQYCGRKLNVIDNGQDRPENASDWQEEWRQYEEGRTAQKDLPPAGDVRNEPRRQPDVNADPRYAAAAGAGGRYGVNTGADADSEPGYPAAGSAPDAGYGEEPAAYEEDAWYGDGSVNWEPTYEEPRRRRLIFPILTAVFGLTACVLAFALIIQSRKPQDGHAASGGAMPTASANSGQNTESRTGEPTHAVPTIPPTATHTPIPTATPEPTNTPTPEPSPTAEPTPTPEPTGTPTPEPTAAPTPTEAPASETKKTAVASFAMPTDAKIPVLPTENVKPDEPKLLKFTGSKASSALPDEGKKIRAARSAIDWDIETSWQEGSKGFGEGEWITVSFSSPKTVHYFDLYLGNWRVPEGGVDFFENNCRPKRMTMIANGQKYTMTFTKEKFMQRVTFDEPVRAAEFKFIIEEAYPGRDEFHDCCISEILAYGTD